MKKKHLSFCLLSLLAMQAAVLAQPSAKELKKINTFNRLFGDYFYVNDRLEIIPHQQGHKSFDTFYSTVRQKNWGAQFENNLENDTFLRYEGDHILLLNLKLREGGVFFEEPTSTTNLEKKKTKSGKNKFYLSSQSLEDYRQIKKTLSKKDSSLNLKLNDFFAKNEYDSVQDRSGYELREFSKKVSKLIKEHSIKHVYFFVHGYNVPHSLAQMQGNKLLDPITSYHGKENILFIRVFWEAGNYKHLHVSTKKQNGVLKLSKITYKDELSLKNATGFSKKKKEAVNCGYAIRRLLNMLQNNKTASNCTYHFISHSLGAVVVSNALINDISPICYKKKEILEITEQMKGRLNLCWIQRIDSLLNKGSVTAFKQKKRANARRIIVFMGRNDLPDLKVTVFMNAPAIPGVPLFQFADMSKSYNFTIGHNLFDPILAKRFFLKQTMLSGFLSGFVGNTRLGVNYNNEVGQTEFLINTSPCKSKDFVLKGYRTSNFFEHDIFYYIQHPQFAFTLDTYLHLND